MKLLRQTFAIAADPDLQTKIFWPRYAYTLARDYTIELEHIRISGTLILDRGIIHQKGGKTFLTLKITHGTAHLVRFGKERR